MIIKYDNATKAFKIKLQESQLGTGQQEFTYKFNCCDSKLIEVIPPIVHQVRIDRDVFLEENTSEYKIFIDSNLISVTWDNFSAVITAMAAIYPNLSITSYQDEEYRYINFMGITDSTTVGFQFIFLGAEILLYGTALSEEYTIIGNGEDGIHSFSVIKQINGQLISESACYFVREDLSCVVVDFIVKEENKNSDVHLLFNALIEASGCNCACDDLCKLYRTLLMKLNILDRCKIC